MAHQSSRQTQLLLELEQILLLILDRILERLNWWQTIVADRHWSTSVGGMSPLTLACHYQCGWLLYMLNLGSVFPQQINLPLI